jgi:glycosyltransferase involved in cell wall biosynthesis
VSFFSVHIAIFIDQHPRSLGGIQTSVMLQKKYLERAGHRVTIVCPNSSKVRATDGFWLLPSWPISFNGEYAFVGNVRRSRKRLDRGFNELHDKFDLVHIQGDMWSGIIGLGFAQRQRLPIVHTMHFNMSSSMSDLFGKWPTRFLFWLFSRELLKHVNRPRSGTTGDPWHYLTLLAAEASIVFAPSHHFAHDLVKHGVTEEVKVMHNGIDDDTIHSILTNAKEHPTVRVPGQPVRLVWSGRLQNEKRPLEFIRAFALANSNAVADIYGKGYLFKKAERLIRELGLEDKVRLRGSVPYAKMLRIFADSDALVQTSVGFETQGMTVYEAAATGTPSILCDSNIAGEFTPGSQWVVKDASVEALAHSIRKAVSDIEAGDRRGDALVNEDHLLQSGATEIMLNYYRSVIEHHEAPKY